MARQFLGEPIKLFNSRKQWVSFGNDGTDSGRLIQIQAGGDVTVMPPGGGAAAISVDTIFTPAAPGLYTAKGSGWSETFAVNLSPAESRTEPIGMEQFQKLGLPMTDSVASPGEIAAAAAAAEKTEAHRREYWQWALAAVLLFVTLETVLAARGSRPAEPVMIT